jgi:hypothetical protein
VLVGDAAHGLSPHISAGGTLGVQDVGVLSRALADHADIPQALKAYEADRLVRYDKVREYSLAVENAVDARDYAEHYAAFSHWMLAERPGAFRRDDVPRQSASDAVTSPRSVPSPEAALEGEQLFGHHPQLLRRDVPAQLRELLGLLVRGVLQNSAFEPGELRVELRAVHVEALEADDLLLGLAFPGEHSWFGTGRKSPCTSCT